MDVQFIIILIVIALFQILGGVFAWVLLKGFNKYQKTALFVEILLMLLVVIELTRQGIETTTLSLIGLGAGFIFIFLINKFIPHRHKDERISRLSKLVFIAMLIHELPEGLAFGSSYAIAADLGIITAFLIGLHNIPEGGIVALPFLLKKNVKQAFKALAATQLAFVIGGLLTYFILIQLSLLTQTMFMTFAAGAMLFIIIEEGLLLRG